MKKMPRVADGRVRVAIERVSPQIDCGRFPIKRVVGETVVVEADVFADGHDHITCQVLYSREGDKEWQSSPMTALGNDRWRGAFSVPKAGGYEYTIEGWIDRFSTWRDGLGKRIAAGQDVHVDLLVGAELIDDAAGRAKGDDAALLRQEARRIREEKDMEYATSIALDEELFRAIERYPERQFATRYQTPLTIVVDREKASFSTWYEVFPRSCSSEAGRHGTLRDCEGWLPYVASMGFDVIYLPPVHPIGHAFRKGKNNSVVAEPNDVGSPWAIGSQEGSHTSIHPELGTLEDFRHFVSEAAEHGLEVALDIAFQCTPDHPYVKQHPEWFRKRPDGTIQYAENPPKKYHDIYPLDFETAGLAGVMERVKGCFPVLDRSGSSYLPCRQSSHEGIFFLGVGYRRDQEGSTREVLFLAEAFTRPHVMYRLAKLGFSQSYTYFTWRNTKQELTDYFTELTQTEVREYFRPNLWPNTPDILAGVSPGRRSSGFHDPLDSGGHPGGQLWHLRTGV